MGKKRVIKTQGQTVDQGLRSRALAKVPKKKLDHGILHIEATYNNTKLAVTDGEGKVVLWSSAGALGFKGAKKGTPFAAGKVGELLAERGQTMGLREVDVVIRGIGSGRESSLRAFASKGIAIHSIKDATPIPFNGPRPPRARRV